MDQDDPEKRIAFSKPTAGKRGYNEDEVDAFLDRVDTARRDATGHTLTPEQVRDIAFSKPPLGKRGYNEDEVDAFLDRVEQEMRRRATGAPQGSSPLAFAPPAQVEFPPPHGPLPPREPPTHRTIASRLNRGGRLGVFIFGLLPLLMIVWAGHGLWAQHSGVPARVEIAECWSTSIFGPKTHNTEGSFTSDCSGVWRPTNGREQMVTVHFVRNARTGETVGVHLHGNQAYTNSGWVLVSLALGIAFLGLLLMLVVPTRRASPASRVSRPSLFHRGPEAFKIPGDAPGAKHRR
jgi:DivIVA domain-containing protein